MMMYNPDLLARFGTLRLSVVLSIGVAQVVQFPSGADDTAVKMLREHWDLWRVRGI